MIPHHPTTRSAASILFTAIFCACAAVAIGCGGGSDSTTSSGPVATFAPDTAAPGAATLALLPGSGTGANIDVRVTVTGVNDVFGAAFRIKYDTTALLFNSMTYTDSLLIGVLPGGVTDSHLFFFEDHLSHPGEIWITATRLDPTVGTVDVTTTSDLVVLNFTARRAIAAAAPEGRVDFSDQSRSVQVCNSAAPPVCSDAAITAWSGGGVSAQ